MSTVVTVYLYNKNQINSVAWLVQQLGASGIYWNVTKAEYVDGQVTTVPGIAVQLNPSDDVDAGTFLGTTLPEKLSLWEFGVQGSSEIQIKVETDGVSELWDINSINDFSLFSTVYAGFTLSSSDPVEDAVNVRAQPQVELVFSRPIETYNLNLDSFIYLTEKGSETPIAAAIEIPEIEGAILNTVVYITPDSALTFSTEYTVHYSVLDKQYESQLSGSFDFTVIDELTLVSVVPADSSSNISRATDIVLTFSTPVSLGDDGSVSLLAGALPVAADVDIDDTVITIVPEDPLEYDTEYSVSYDLYDGVDEVQTINDTKSFTTIVEPLLSSSDPADESIDHPIADSISLVFNIDVALGETGSVVLLQGETEIPASVSIVGSIVTVNPTDSLVNETEYTVTWELTDAFSAGETISGSITFTTVAA